MDWFEVDKAGLAKLMERRGKAYVINELVQNALDAGSTHIDVQLTRVPSTRSVELRVTDDSPTGFDNLAHAWTLFAESAKKGNAELRGRYNFGEKLVLALCSQAYITSTTGTVAFDAKGKRRSRERTERGSVFFGRLVMTDGEMQECGDAVRALLIPEGVVLRFNGDSIAPRRALAVTRGKLPTEMAGDDGALRRLTRTTNVEIHAPLEGEAPRLYELGIPVMDLPSDRYSLNVMQKIPMGLERDAVTPAYLALVRALALEAMSEQLAPEDANSAWVKDAVLRHGEKLSPDTVHRLADLRFGEQRVSFDPSDQEANKIAVSKGYQVVHGSQLSRREWDVFKAAGAIAPAGQVTPSPKPYSADGREEKLLDRSKWSTRMRAVVAYIERLGNELLGQSVNVEIVSDVGWPFAATYGGGRLTLNLGRLGHRWFDGALHEINDLMIHEFGHEWASDHLSDDYYRALTKLGARMTSLALASPDLFRVDEKTCFKEEGERAAA